jgi:hypothetical protein
MGAAVVAVQKLSICGFYITQANGIFYQLLGPTLLRNFM